MKTVKLTQAEIDVILASVDERHICEAHCYCGYKTDMCNKLTKDGKYRCKLQQTIQDIENKLQKGGTK